MRFSRSVHLLMFVFWDFKIHHKDWLTYSGGSDKPGELCYNFSISNDLTQTVNFPTRIPDCDSHSPALTLLFISSDVNICSTMAFPPLGNSDHVAVSVSIDFPSNSQRDGPFHRIAYDSSLADWDGLRDQQVKPHSSKISGQASLISMVFSFLRCCHSSKKSLFSFVPKV